MPRYRITKFAVYLIRVENNDRITRLPNREGLTSAIKFRKDKYSKKFYKIAKFLLLGERRLENISFTKFSKFRRNTLYFFIRRSYLF